MNWKNEAIEKLKGYEAHRQTLENIPLELDRLSVAYTGIHPAKVDGMAIACGGSH